MNRLLLFLAAILSASVALAGGDVVVLTSTTSTGTNAALTATSSVPSGVWVEQVDIAAGTGVTGTVAVALASMDAQWSGTILSTNVTGSNALYPRLAGGGRYFICREKLTLSVTDMSTSNTAVSVRVKYSDR